MIFRRSAGARFTRDLWQRDSFAAYMPITNTRELCFHVWNAWMNLELNEIDRAEK